jgi:hypothetical protein
MASSSRSARNVAVSSAQTRGGLPDAVPVEEAKSIEQGDVVDTATGRQFNDDTDASPSIAESFPSLDFATEDVVAANGAGASATSETASKENTSQGPEEQSRTASDTVADDPEGSLSGLAEAVTPFVGRATEVVIEERATIVAYIDGVDSRGCIEGWAWVPASPQRRVSVNIYHGDELISFGTGNTLREDVRGAGHGDGQYGYSIQLPERLLDGKREKFSIHFEATGAQSHSTVMQLQLPQRLPLRGPMASSAARAMPLPPMPEPSMAPIYVPGQQVLCFAPHPLAPYHVTGWHAPEADFTWIDGLEGVLELSIRRPQNAYTLMLDVVPNGVAGQLQTLEVFVNYFRMGFYEVRRATTVQVELPAEIFTLRRTRISLHCRNAIVPSEHGVAGDLRRLGVAVCSWIIV